MPQFNYVHSLTRLETRKLLGTIFILRKDIGVGGSENGNFSLIYVMKMSLHRAWVVLKMLKIPLRNIKMAPEMLGNKSQYR